MSILSGNSKRWTGRVPLVLVGACLSGWALPTPHAAAGSQDSVANIENYKALAARPEYKWAGAMTVQFPDASLHTSSCVAVAPTVVIGAGHTTPGPTSVSIVKTVTFGANYNSGARLIMDVDHWEIIPSYEFGNPNTTDLAVLYLRDPIPNFTAVSFGDAPLGSVAVQVDYGDFGDTSTGELPSLGFRLAGRAIVSEAYRPASSYPASKYFLLNFQGTGSTEPTQGLFTSSGAGWKFDGKIVAISTAKFNGTIDVTTVALRLNTPEVQNFLQPKIQASWAAQPATYYARPKLELAREGNGVKVSWTEQASGCILEKSTDLAVWNAVLTDAASPTNTVLFGAGSVTFTDQAPRRYFRLRVPL